MYRVTTQSLLIIAAVLFLTVGLLSATGFPKFPEYPIAFAATTVADFNGDGHLDVLGITQCSPTPCSTSTIAVSLGICERPVSAPHQLNS